MSKRLSTPVETITFTPLSNPGPSMSIRVDEKPLGEISLTNLLQCSPQDSKSAQSQHLSFYNSLGVGASSSFLSSSTSYLAKHRSSSTAITSYNLESSKLSILDKPDYVEALDIKSKRKMRKIRQIERERTKGKKWFNMQATELTQDRKNDLEALRLRGALDTKRFYKRNNITTQPKYFQVGRIIESSADYYNSRIPKKQRKQTLAEEMIAEVSSSVSHLK